MLGPFITRGLSSLLLFLFAFFSFVQFVFALDIGFFDYFSIGSRSQVWYDQTPKEEDRFWALLEEAWAQAQWKSLSAYARYNVESAYPDENPEFLAKYYLAQAFLKFSSKHLDAHIGDEHVLLGRGLDLSLVERKELKEELSLQGLGVLGKSDYFQLGGSYGYINKLEGPPITPARVTSEITPLDDKDALWFAYAAFTPKSGSIELVYSAGELQPQFELVNDLPDPFQIWGINAEFFGELGELFMGYANYKQQNKIKGFTNELMGEAVYFSATITNDPITVVIEGKDYSNFTFIYAQPPTLEHPKLAFEEPYFDDVSGAHGGLRWKVFQPLTLKLDGYYQDRRLGGFGIEQTRHVYGGFDCYTKYISAIIDGGYRHEEYGYYHHGYASVQITPISWLSFDLHYHFKDFYAFPQYALLKSNFSDDLYRLGLSYRGIVSGYVQYERSDEPISALGTPYGKDISLKGPDYWGYGIKIQPADWITSEIFYGQQKGGLSCAGGVCRALPPFQGLKFDVGLIF